MTQLKNHIWYASYGSNILEERFLCYIRGGKPKGSSKIHKGCTDKSLPKSNKEFLINRELYFARNSKSWDNGGVAFIRDKIESRVRTFGRIYLITVDQLIDVVKQEIDFEGSLKLDFEKAIKNGSLVYKKTKWYGKILYLGDQEGYPVFTFTSEQEIKPVTKPSHAYIKTIISGIQETYNYLTLDDIVDYLISKKGILDIYNKVDLKQLAEN